MRDPETPQQQTSERVLLMLELTTRSPYKCNFSAGKCQGNPASISRLVSELGGIAEMLFMHSSSIIHLYKLSSVVGLAGHNEVITNTSSLWLKPALNGQQLNTILSVKCNFSADKLNSN